MSKLLQIKLDMTTGPAALIDGLEKHAGDLLRGVMNSVRRDIVLQADAVLNTSRADYKKGLSPVRISKSPNGLVGTIVLTGDLANMIEDGADPFDMHNSILGTYGNNVKVNQRGRLYAVVPFTHKKPGARGRTPMGQQYSVPMDIHALGKKVYSYAKEIGNKPGQAKSMPYGMFPKVHPNERQVGPYKAAANTHDPFGGMAKQTKEHGGGLKTFRTISDEVPNKWYHPGIKAHNFFDKASVRVEHEVNQALSAIMKNMGKGLK